MKTLLKFNYRTEIRLSLLLFILFFLLINFEIVYLLNLSKKGWNEESLQNLKGAAYSASLLWQNTQVKAETDKEIKALASLWGVKRIDILDKKGEALISENDGIGKGQYLNDDSLLSRTRVRLLAGKSFVSEIYSGPGKRFYQSYFYSFTDQKTQNPLYVRVEKEVTRLAWLERISRYEGWARGAGIFGVILLSFLLLRNILSPYQRMKKKAEEEQIISPSAERRC